MEVYFLKPPVSLYLCGCNERKNEREELAAAPPLSFSSVLEMEVIFFSFFGFFLLFFFEKLPQTKRKKRWFVLCSEGSRSLECLREARRPLRMV